jgi:hypothetical protein
LYEVLILVKFREIGKRILVSMDCGGGKMGSLVTRYRVVFVKDDELFLDIERSDGQNNTMNMF